MSHKIGVFIDKLEKQHGYWDDDIKTMHKGYFFPTESYF